MPQIFAAMFCHDLSLLLSHTDVACFRRCLFTASRRGGIEDFVDEQFTDGVGAGVAGEDDGYLVFGGVLPEGVDASGLE